MPPRLQPQRPQRFADVRRPAKTMCRFALYDEPRIARWSWRVYQSANDVGRERKRDVAECFVRSRRKRHRKKVVVDDFDAPVELSGEFRGERAVDLDRDHTTRTLRERQRERTASRADFDNEIRSRNRRGANQTGSRRPFTKKVLG